jgi:hypothetical protein
MVVLTREGTWYANKKRFDIFAALVKGAKDEKLRLACLGYLRDYLRYATVVISVACIP